MKHRLAAILLVVLGCLIGLLAWNCFSPVSLPAQVVPWQPTTQWLTPPTPRHRFYLRRTVTLAAPAQGGWLRLSADNDFVLYVNGQAIAEEYSYFGRIPRNSLGLGKYFSETTQTLNDSSPYDLRTGDIIQASYTKDWKLTGYFDLTHYLQPGKNVIAVEVQASHLHPRFLADGAIYPTLDRSAPISLETGTTDWMFSPLPVNRQKLKWFDIALSDQDWIVPQRLPLAEKTYSRLSAPIFDQLLHGTWITGREGPHGEVSLQTQWTLPKKPQRAVVRFASEGQYSLLLNGQLVHQTQVDIGNQLNLYDVTHLVHAGQNTLTARLLRPLAIEWQSDHNNPLSLFLDGWVEDAEGHLSSAIATDESWHSLILNSANSGAIIETAPVSHRLSRVYLGDASRSQIGQYLVMQAAWMVGGVLSVFAAAWGLGRFVQRPDDIDRSVMLAGSAILTPSLLFLTTVGLLKHRYAESERGIFFAQAHLDWLILCVALCTTVLALLWVCRPPQISAWHKSLLLFLASWLGCTGLSVVLNSYLPLLLVAAGSAIFYLSRMTRTRKLQQFLAANRLRQLGQFMANLRYEHWFLVAILLLGFVLRSHDIGFNDLEPDENVSYDAVRGILRTGVPIATSEIWYTRGPFFHYPLALWLKIVGLSPEHARMWSVLWAIGTLVMVFVFTRLISGKAWVALVATLVISIDPWELWYSRNVRFYQQTQFLYLLSYWSFYRGFIEASIQEKGPNRWYQYTCFISLACILLTQEVTMTLLPAFTIGALYFYRAYQWKSDWRVVISGFMTSSMFVFNAVVFSIKCLTPLVGLSSMTTGHLKFQVANVTFFGTDFFVGFNRMHVIYSLLFFGGWLYWCWRGDGRKLFLFNTVLINITFVTVLVSLKASRYTYPFYPLYSLLAIYSGFVLAQWLGEQIQSWIGQKLPVQKIAIAAMALLLLGNIEPDRVLASYSESLTPRHLEISQYIVDHKQPGDVVISNTPSVHANVLKGADYYVPHRMSFFDAVYLHNGRLIDRWEGRQVLTNSDQLDYVLAHANRVWIHVFHQAQLPRDAELAKFYDTLQTISQPVLDSYGASLRLWRREDGVLRPSPNRGRDFGAY